MDANRIIQIVITELSLENLKLQESLEVAINNAETIDDKVKTVKEILEKIVINESSLVKFQALVSNKNDLNQKEDGKI